MRSFDGSVCGSERGGGGDSGKLPHAVARALLAGGGSETAMAVNSPSAAAALRGDALGDERPQQLAKHAPEPASFAGSSRSAQDTSHRSANRSAHDRSNRSATEGRSGRGGSGARGAHDAGASRSLHGLGGAEVTAPRLGSMSLLLHKASRPAFQEEFHAVFALTGACGAVDRLVLRGEHP